jgi:quercetin dioxygenase-like cupin family protein
MRRRFVVRSLAALALAPAVAGQGSRAHAQEATPPAAGQDGLPEGVSARVVASGWVDITAPGRATMDLARIALSPGTSAPFGSETGAAALVYVASGELTFRVGAPVTVARRPEPGTPTPPEAEAVEAETDFVLRDGDSTLFPPGIAGEVRNDGSGDAAAWVVTLGLAAADAGTPSP